ncbi:MAG: lamin tail domain-containing protein, partial [Candidatus Veblenbacteria bacterium]|nr:lamin tail domain-containing protein [Candidatus Veblenbacteria bacterium]
MEQKRLQRTRKPTPKRRSARPALSAGKKPSVSALQSVVGQRRAAVARQHVSHSPLLRLRRRLVKGIRHWEHYWSRQAALYAEYEFHHVVAGRGLAPRLVAALTLLVFTLSQLGTMDFTRAYYSDVESSADNILQSDSLDFSASPNGPSEGTVGVSNPATYDIDITQVGGLGFQYTAALGATTGSFCDSLHLKASVDGSEVYDDALASFTSGPHVFAAPGQWSFEVSLTGPNEYGPECEWGVLFKAWQENVAAYDTLHFTDSHEVSLKTLALRRVVINEVMWMGSEQAPQDDANDEWIELRNMSGSSIDILGWKIGNAQTGSTDLIILNHVMAPGAYYVISNYNKADSAMNVTPNRVTAVIGLHNDYAVNGQLTLWDAYGNLVDEAPVPAGSDWPRGKNESSEKWSMERNLTPGDGTLSASWHTCTPTIMSPADLATMKSYWDVAAQDYVCGTPKNANLSANDPTAPDYDPLAGT